MEQHLQLMSQLTQEMAVMELVLIWLLEVKEVLELLLLGIY